MKNYSRYLGTIVVLAALVLSFSACDDLLGSLIKGDPTTNTVTYKPMVYTNYGANGTEYELIITRPGKAAVSFTPAAGDSYKLDITTAAGVTQTSSGTVKGFSGNKFTLAASNNASVSFEVAISGNAINNITGTITVEGGVTVNGPGTLTPASGFVAVTGITGVPTSGTVGTLTLTGTVAPANATSKTIAWSVKSPGTTGATISGSTLTTTATGTVTVTATIANGKTASTSYTQDFSITITSGSSTQTFTSIADMAAWLSNQPANSATSPYTVKLNVSDLGGSSSTSGSAGKALIDNSNKYVSLDLSGSTFSSIGQGAFNSCASLTSVTIPNSVTGIEYFAFIWCTSLTGVTIGSGVTSIHRDAFSGCTSLTAFNVATGNNTYASEDGVLYNKNKTALIRYPLGKTASSFTIPNSVTSIGEAAFIYCDNLTSVTIPNSVTSIEENAFQQCYNLTSVAIPDSVTSIGSGAFTYNRSLASVTIGNGVIKIENDTFGDCDSLTSVTIGNGVTSIDKEAFSGCTSLTEFNVATGNNTYASENGVLYNKNKTALIRYFEGKTGSFTIPNSVTTIKDWAFAYCTSLTGVTIPGSVTKILNMAFYECTGLTSVTFQGTIVDLGELAFDPDIGGDDLRDKYLAGGIGTYTRAANGTTWTKQ